jgi:alkane 1-monooxygenase
MTKTSDRADCAHSIGFLISLLPGGLIPLSWWLGQTTGLTDPFAWLPLLVIFGIVPIIDRIVGTDPVTPEGVAPAQLRNAQWYRAILLASLPIQVTALAFGAWVFANANLNWFGALGWVVSCGLVSGIIAINVAHELIHKGTRLEQWTGGVLMSTVCYGTFPIEHVYGHHQDIGTPKDPLSARFGQHYYAFFANALRENFIKAWKLERQRLASEGRSLWSAHNALLCWYGLTITFAFALYLLFGFAGLAFFFLQAFFAIANLEAVNYIEHYGLVRRKTADGGFERIGSQHSWNANWKFTNLLLINLQRHADHHLYSRRPYELLRHLDESPQLPAGYGAMIPLAMIPPLWHRIIDPRLLAYLRDRGQPLPTKP